MRRIGFILITLIILFIGYKKISESKKTNQQTETTKVQRGNLVSSVAVSGQVSSANSAEVTTQASGVVNKVLVKDGDIVKSGDIIATLDLDLVGKQRAQQAYASYQSAQNNADLAKANLYSSQSTMLTDWESYMAKATNATYENADESPNTSNRKLTDFVITQNDWLIAEAKYKIQQQTINQTQSALSSGWYAYQQTSPNIVAPISGVITGLSLQSGTVITAQTNSSGGSSSQRIASVKTSAAPAISLNITQIDAPKIKAGNKATVTFDAFPDTTYSGEVVSIDTIGSQSSGVTTYTTYVKLDSEIEGLLPNMSAAAEIITASKNNILMIPSALITTQGNTSYVRMMKNNQITQQEVETGLSNDTMTEIINGLTEGDIIVSLSTNDTSQTPNQTSPFSPFGRTGTGGNRQFQMITR